MKSAPSGADRNDDDESAIVRIKATLIQVKSILLFMINRTYQTVCLNHSSHFRVRLCDTHSTFPTAVASYLINDECLYDLIDNGEKMDMHKFSPRKYVTKM